MPYIGRTIDTRTCILGGNRKILEEQGAVKLIPIWSERDGEAVELYLGNICERYEWKTTEISLCIRNDLLVCEYHGVIG